MIGLTEIIKTENGVFYQGNCLNFLSSRTPHKNEYIFTDPPYRHGKKIISSPCGKWRHLKQDYSKVPPVPGDSAVFSLR
jgi:16S rRNA G966 N2-methylase RsmD